MGITGCAIISLPALDTSNWIDLIGIIVNSALAVWIVITIQNKVTNRRVLKDHFINEIKAIKGDYQYWLNDLCHNRIHPKIVIPWFKLMNIKIDDLLDSIGSKYKIDKNILNPYQIELREILTENEEFIKQFESDQPLVFSETSINSIIMFQQVNSHLFNEIIIKINDSNG